MQFHEKKLSRKKLNALRFLSLLFWIIIQVGNLKRPRLHFKMQIISNFLPPLPCNTSCCWWRCGSSFQTSFIVFPKWIWLQWSESDRGGGVGKHTLEVCRHNFWRIHLRQIGFLVSSCTEYIDLPFPLVFLHSHQKPMNPWNQNPRLKKNSIFCSISRWSLCCSSRSNCKRLRDNSYIKITFFL